MFLLPIFFTHGSHHPVTFPLPVLNTENPFLIPNIGFRIHQGTAPVLIQTIDIQSCIVQSHSPLHCEGQNKIIAVAIFMHLQADLVIGQEVNLSLCVLHNLLDILRFRILRGFRKFFYQLLCVPWIVQLISILDSQVVRFLPQSCMPVFRTADHHLHLY